jgi:hypothetical protein
MTERSQAGVHGEASLGRRGELWPMTKAPPTRRSSVPGLPVFLFQEHWFSSLEKYIENQISVKKIHI